MHKVFCSISAGGDLYDTAGNKFLKKYWYQYYIWDWGGILDRSAHYRVRTISVKCERQNIHIEGEKEGLL
jgi:hypothetical protein